MSCMDHSRRKKNCCLWTWIFSLAFSTCLVQTQWIASIIIIIEQCCSHCRALTNKEHCKHSISHSSAHRPLSLQSLLWWSQMQWWQGGGKTWTGSFGLAWWPIPLAQVGVPRHLSHGVASPTVLALPTVGGSHCCHHHLQAQIDILTLQYCTAAIKCLHDILINNGQLMTRSLKSSLLCRCQQPNSHKILSTRATHPLHRAVCFFFVVL